MSGSMTAAVLTAPDVIEIREIPIPNIPSGWALVRTEYTGLCGTDFGILHGDHPRARPPLIMGHEITGIVEVASPSGPPVGARVIVEPLISCGACAPCKGGDSHVCQNLTLFGIDRAGSMAQFVALPAHALIAVDKSVPAKQAALAEPVAVAVHSVFRSGIRGGESVLIFGAGPIGILTALVAQRAGAQSILIVEPSEERRAFAEDLGFNVVAAGADPVEAIRAATGGIGADVVFDTAAHPAVAALLARCARVLGTVVLVGVYKRPAAIDLQTIAFSEVTVLGVRVYTRRDVERAVALLEANALGLDRIPLEIFPLEQASAAFARAMESSGVLKVLVGHERS